MKSDKATIRQRVEEVLQLRLLGAEFVDIRQHASAADPPWNVSDRQLWRYIERSDTLLERTLEKDREKLLNRHLAQRRALYARTMAVSDYRTSLAVLKDEADLLGLYPSRGVEAQDESCRPDLSAYVDDPVGYAQKVLDVTLTPDQEAILRGLTVPPFKVEVPSGHDTGKTFCAAVACNWWYDTRDPGIVLTTAPTQRDVVDLLWTEVRLQRQRVGLPSDFRGERAPMMLTSEEHYAKGFTAKKGETFKGRHRPRMLFIFDEANEIDAPYFDTTKTMFDPSQGHAWLCIYNPTNTTTAAYQIDQQAQRDGSWHRIQLSALNHPNIKAQLEGKPPPVPGAVSLNMINEWVRDWCDPIKAEEHRADDLEWPPGSGQWHRPGPIFQCRALGLWPSAGTYGVWSPLLWDAVSKTRPDAPTGVAPEIGCDVARYGDDWTVIVARVGPVAVHHEAHNGWDTTQIAGRLKELCQELGRRYDHPPERIMVKIDDDGVGGGVLDQRGAFRFIGINAGSVPMRPGDYPNKRSELWFLTTELARKGLVCLGNLEKEALARLQTQALAPTWTLDAAGRRKVEDKAETKKKIRRSPDDMDAVNLCFYHAFNGVMQAVEVTRGSPPRLTIEQRARGRASGHGFGKG